LRPEEATVTTERVEKVARKLWEQARSEYDYDWDSNRDQFLEQARVILAVLDAVPVTDPGQELMYPAVQEKAWSTARGFVRFVNLRPDRKNGYWVCDTCGKKVTKSNFEKHAHDERGY
jgi:hypothetical protein